MSLNFFSLPIFQDVPAKRNGLLEISVNHFQEVEIKRNNDKIHQFDDSIDGEDTATVGVGSGTRLCSLNALRAFNSLYVFD